MDISKHWLSTYFSPVTGSIVGLSISKGAGVATTFGASWTFETLTLSVQVTVEASGLSI